MTDTLVVSCARATNTPKEPVTYLTLQPEGDATAIQFFACARYNPHTSLLQQFWQPIRLAANILLGNEQLLGEMVITGSEKHRELAMFFEEREARTWELEED